MGVNWSKEKESQPVEQSSRPTLPEKTVSKRSFASTDNLAEPSNNKKNKHAHFKKKDSWAKKEGNKKPKGGELQERPEHLGPREPRIPKKKVALLVGFNGTGYQGMQL
jgi:tRNA pseudouridine38-40 synthase